MTNTEKGKYGEDLAAKYLVGQGYKIVETNYRYSRFGEIDIIAQKGSHLSFVEVKTRKNEAFGHPLEAVNLAKIQKIILTMRYFLSVTKIKHKTYSLDVISILLDTGKIEHLKNIEL